jgi:hypothetical protein
VSLVRWLIVAAAVVAAVAAAVLRLARRGSRYAYGRWRDPDPALSGLAPIIDGP